MMQTQPQVSRQPYSSPELRVYGDIREITHGFGVNGENDNVPATGKEKTS
jgi:hypothetical protein